MGFKLSRIWGGRHKAAMAKLPDGAFTPKERELKGGLAANGRLLRGIYDGDNQDFALGAYALTGFVKIYKNLIGVPGVLGDDDPALVTQLLPLLFDEYPILVKTMLVIGTAWRWTRWSDTLHRLVWEAIPDDAITQIVVDPDSGEILELYVDEYIEFNKRYQAVEYGRRERHITRERVSERWRGEGVLKIVV